MSTNASPLNASANNSPPPQTPLQELLAKNSNTMNTSSTSAAAPTAVKIKKELPSDEIKEFAESTMNELLGWYGFDSVDRLDLSAKTSKMLQTAGILSSQQQQQHQQQQQNHPVQHPMEKRRSRSSRGASLLHMQQQQRQRENEHLRPLNDSNNHNSNNNNSNGSNNNNNNNNSAHRISSSLTNCNNIKNTYRSAIGGNDSTTSDHDTRSSRDDDSKSPNSACRTHVTAGSIVDEKIVDYQNCCWCHRSVPENAPEFLATTDGPRYCSESCFTQSRRASFKKAKTCDWCKHVRHAVSYVDFQDGASQLQFCSDKCLNQYKMQIFCIETQAHLDMNPHLKEQGREVANNDGNLITPDLWLRNCRSRSLSPASTISVSPGPPIQTNISAERTSLSPLPARIAVTNSMPNTNAVASHKPLISVAPVSKLMSKSPNILPSRQSPKLNRKKRPVRTGVTNDLANNRANDAKSSSATSISGNCKTKPLLATLNDNARTGLNQTNTQTLPQFSASCVQDLHMNMPPLSPMMDSQSSQPTTPHSLPLTSNRGNSNSTLTPAFFATPPNTQGLQPPVPPVIGMTSQGFPHQRPPFIPNITAEFLPRFMGHFPGLPLPPVQAASGLLQPDLTALNALIGTPPPVTIMVPYPVIIPLPIPIPIPLPIVDFYKAYLKPEERKKFEEEQETKKENKQENETNHNNNEDEPLDFTKTKETYIQKHLQQDVENLPKPMEVVTSPRNSTSSEDSQSNNSKTIMCVVTSEEAIEQNNLHKNKKDPLSNDIVQPGGHKVREENTETNQQKLPKLKITRLQTKRTLMQTKESECSRPLRKRKRIIDCDFQKLNNNNPTKDATTTTNNNTTEGLQETTTDNEELNAKDQNTTNNNCNKN